MQCVCNCAVVQASSPQAHTRKGMHVLMGPGIGRNVSCRDIPCSPTPVSPTPVSPTLDKKVAFRLLVKKTALCNILNINELLNIQHNNNTTLYYNT